MATLTSRQCRPRALIGGAFVSFAVLSGCGGSDKAKTGDSAATASGTSAPACSGDAGLTLPSGFCATIFADSIGHARHVVVAPNGTVYVNTWSGGGSGGGAIHEGGFLVALRDTSGDGKADLIARFGRMSPATSNTPSGSPAARGPESETSGAGGTGIAIYNGYLYAEEGSTVVRYAMNSESGSPPVDASSMIPPGKAEVVVERLPMSGDHAMHPFVIDANGNLFMDLGSATNSCQVKNRELQSPGHKPCTELETRGGIWRFDANKLHQAFSPSARFATGIRNAVGLAIAPDGSLYVTQHGRDQLAENWPRLYTPEEGQNLPAEELLHVQQGADYGWPVCYFDDTQRKLVLAPEYGGDGGKAVGECASKTGPVAFFPAHWAPDGMVFYTGNQFPDHYRGGAFIAFHGSWNRAPGPQGGYLVAFVPFAAGHPASADKFEKFANGFAGGTLQPDAADHRPVGVAQGPDGSLYITDDKGGTVFRVVHTGGTTR